MPSLRDLANNIATFDYYSGRGNFSQNITDFGGNGPLMTTPAGFRWSPSNFDGGLVPYGAITRTTRTLYDVARITKWMYTTPQGPAFLAKQVGLQLMNVNTEHPGESVGSTGLRTNRPTTGQGFITNIGNFIANTTNRVTNDYGETRIYNPLGTNTLAQVALNGVGGRVTRHGFLPIPTGDSRSSSYENYILSKDKGAEEGVTGNRLVTLSYRLSSPDRNTVILQYKGGPESLYGIGNTTINRKYYTMSNINGGIPVSNLIRMRGELASGNYTIESPNGQRGSEANLYQFGNNIDFRSTKKKMSVTTIDIPSTDYRRYNTEDRIGVVRNRTRQQRVDYSSVGSVDKVNALSIFRAANVEGEKGLDNVFDFNGEPVAGNTRDMIKFRIKSIDNDKPNEGIYMVFRSFISKIRRTINSKWNPYTYVGRGESFYRYDGVTETISIGFTIVALTRSEMKPIYQKLNYLMSTLSPDYNGAFMRGNLSELTIGDFIKYQPGIITSLDLDIDDEAAWEIAMDEPASGRDSDMHELPHMIKCSMNFIPIYNFLPRKSDRLPFIGIDNTEANTQQKEKKNWLIPEERYVNPNTK